jgi:hypothetical protein
MPPKIITRPSNSPDPNFAWEAFEDGGHENMTGYGRTEQEAKADLSRLQGEMAEWEDFPPSEDEA